MSGTPVIQRTIEGAFDARVNPRPLDYINEPNLRTYRLALVDDEEPSSTPEASNLAIETMFMPSTRVVATLAPASLKSAPASLGNSLGT